MVRVSARGVALSAFFVATLAFSFTAVAAAQYYLEIMRSVQSAEIHASSFEVMIVDASNGTFTFRMAIMNPSGASLRVRLLSYAISLNGKFVAARAVDYSVQELQIAPNSDTAFVVSTRLMPSEVNSIVEGSSNAVWNWELRGTLRLRTAIDSDFQISFLETWSGQPVKA